MGLGPSRSTLPPDGHSSLRTPLGAVLLVLALAAPVPASEAPVVLGVAIDTSGSIPAEELQATRELVVTTLDKLPGGSEVVLFTFDDESRQVLPRTADRDAIRYAISTVKAAGRHTSLHDALYDVSRTLTALGAQRRAVLMLTDGVDENSALNLEDGLAVAVAGHIPVFTVATGKPNERVLRRIAKLTGGGYLAGKERTAAVLSEKLRQLPDTSTTIAGTAVATPAPMASTAPAAMGSPRPAESSSRFPFAWLAGGMLVLLGLSAIAFLLSRSGKEEPRGHRCATCGRALSGPLASCAHCDRPPVPAPAPALPPEDPHAPTFIPGRAPKFVPDISPTVLERLNMTEEYLDKTVTLRDRPVLVVSSGGVAGQVYDLSYETAISLGRSKANDIILNDVGVSSQHCRVRPEGEGFEVLDLNSTNGTWLNERRVTRQKLVEGDKIRVGDTTLEFRHQQRYD